MKVQESDARSGVWWSAYSANGTVEGSIVYANYGRSADFDMLKNVRTWLSDFPTRFQF